MAYTKLPKNTTIEAFSSVTLLVDKEHFFNKEDIIMLLALPGAVGLTVLNYNPNTNEDPDKYPSLVATKGQIIGTGYDELLLNTGDENKPAIVVLGCPPNDIPRHLEVKYNSKERKFEIL